MFQQLQDYLFQYKTVAIPGIGTLQLQPQSAALDVANQLLFAPSYEIRFSHHVSISRHQLEVLASAYDNSTEAAGAELARFGAAFYSRLQQRPFSWKGIGALELSGNNIGFVPAGADGTLEPVAAQRVLRENVQHSVLIGDQEMQVSASEYEPALDEKKSRYWSLIVGWIIALLALLFIGYHLYLNNWVPAASGLQQKPAIESAPEQHR